MSKRKKTTKDILSRFGQRSLYNTVYGHYDDSWTYLVSPQIDSWDEKEKILVNKIDDDISAYETTSQVYDPRLSTIVLERAARVMSQNPVGKVTEMSRNDMGKSAVMRLLANKWIIPHANSQFPFLVKSRLWDIYSMVYGVMFALTDWVIKDDIEVPDYYLLPIRDTFPQLGKMSLADSDWVGVATWVNEEWLKARDKNTWHNIDEVLLRMKEGQTEVKGEKDNQKRSAIERDRQPSVKGDQAFKQVQIYTEYRRDKWITICTTFGDEKFVLREIKNPHHNHKLPVVAKYCFPLLDSIYGLGEFERGKTLQYATNSLINLYLEGVKMSLFPPKIINPDGVVPSSIVDEAAAKWLETKPNSIREYRINPQGINTFQSTYNFLVAAIHNQAGTTDTTTAKDSDITQGKTPAAIKMMAGRENSRDNWDRFMMEQALQEVMQRFVDLTTKNLSKDVVLRLFPQEVKEIAQAYPDAVELFGQQARVNIQPKHFKGSQFDYQIISGSTYKVDKEQELANLRSLLSMAIDPQTGQILSQALAQKGKKINVAELFQRLVVSSGTQDWDKIIVDISPEEQQQMAAPQQAAGGQPPPPPQQPVALQDPEIEAFAKQLFGQ